MGCIMRPFVVAAAALLWLRAGSDSSSAPFLRRRLAGGGVATGRPPLNARCRVLTARSAAMGAIALVVVAVAPDVSAAAQPSVPPVPRVDLTCAPQELDLNRASLASLMNGLAIDNPTAERLVAARPHSDQGLASTHLTPRYRGSFGAGSSDTAAVFWSARN